MSVNLTSDMTRISSLGVKDKTSDQSVERLSCKLIFVSLRKSNTTSCHPMGHLPNKSHLLQRACLYERNVKFALNGMLSTWINISEMNLQHVQMDTVSN